MRIQCILVNVLKFIGLIVYFMTLALVQSSWAQPVDQQAEFTFVVIGDSRPNRPGLTQCATYKRILEEINKIKPAFVVNTGDVIYGSRDRQRFQDQYRDYLETTKSLLEAKVYLTLGNHEILGYKPNQEFFEKELGGLYYSFDWAGSHFIVLNTEIIGEESRITGKQLEWLKQDLYTSRSARHKFIFLHRPLYPVDGHKGKCLDSNPKERDELHSLFVRSRVTAVFAGHEHLFHHEIRNGVHYIITGGGGAFLYPSIQGTGDFHHYVVVSVAGDKIQMKAINIAQNGMPEEIIPIGRGSTCP